MYYLTKDLLFIIIHGKPFTQLANQSVW